jgi:hypothetical protein
VSKVIIVAPMVGISPPGRSVAAHAAAAKQRTAPIAAAISKAESKADPDDAITGPIRAVATNPPVRATALFRPDAAPVWRLSTDISRGRSGSGGFIGRPLGPKRPEYSETRAAITRPDSRLSLRFETVAYIKPARPSTRSEYSGMAMAIQLQGFRRTHFVCHHNRPPFADEH